MNSFYFDEMHMLYNQNKSYVKSCKKNIAFKKNIVFPKKPLFYQKTHCFPTCALFYPIVLKRKIITDGSEYVSSHVSTARVLYWHNYLKLQIQLSSKFRIILCTIVHVSTVHYCVKSLKVFR